MPRTDLIRVRRGTASQWTAANPTLEAGEFGEETDTHKVKIGPGSWNSLSYLGGGGSGGGPIDDGSVTLAKLNNALTVTAAESIAANNNDNTIPTSAAVKQYADSVAAGGGGGPITWSSIDGKPTVIAAGADQAAARSAISAQAADADLSALAALSDPAGKLSGIASGATVNSPDATLLNRANHTGTQSQSTVSNLPADLASKLSATIVDAKGDILVGTGADAITRQAAGSIGTVLTPDPNQASGIKYARMSTVSMDPVTDGVMPVGAGFDCTALTITGTAPGDWTGMQYFAPGTNRVRFGGNMVDNGGVFFNQINTGTGGQGASGYEAEFYFHGNSFAFHLFAYGEMDFKIIVDGQHLQTRKWMTNGSLTGQCFVRINFATTKTRKIRFFNGQLGWVQVLGPSASQCYPAEPRPKWLFTGDSFFHGTGSTTEGGITAGTTPNLMAMRMGIEAWNFGIGGTGLQNPGGGSGSSKYGSSTRLLAYSSMTNVKGIVVVGPANDGSLGTYPVAGTRTAMTALATALRTYHPLAPLFWMGVEAGVYPSIDNDLNTLDSALLAEAALHPELITRYVSARSGVGTPWVSGNGQLDNWTGTGNADLFVSSDDVHPTHMGWEHYTDRFIAAIRDDLYAH